MKEIPLVFDDLARRATAFCRVLAGHSDERSRIVRPFCSPAMKHVHDDLLAWMARLGMAGSLDAAGNLRGVRRAAVTAAPCLYLGSHLDTVPDAGAFDGVLGVVWALAVIEAIGDHPLGCDIEVLGFSDEEGVRFGVPFIGSRAVIGTLDAELLGTRDADGTTVAAALRAFGADPDAVDRAIARRDAVGYVECHIEQGPVLEQIDRPLGLVDRIAGQTRAEVEFHGVARHAGTTPMSSRRDALASAAEWIVAVERLARETQGAVATVGRVDVEPGAGNVIAATARAWLDVRHADDPVRRQLAGRIRDEADVIAARRGVSAKWRELLDSPAMAMDPALTSRLSAAGQACGVALAPVTSGAGHDAMIMAARMPAAMLFVRSPGGVSHHPDETVIVSDVAAAIAVGREFVIDIAGRSVPHSGRADRA